jgi:prepilin-type processing-associated H-X9-DG protein
MEMAVKRMKGAGRRRWRGELLPCRRHHGGAPPLAPFLHGFLGALLHGDGIHGGGKNVAFGDCNSWVEESPTS